MHVGTRIRAWRNERGLTQNELAQKSHISRSYLAGVETGKYNPSLDTLGSIAEALGLSTSILLDEPKPGPLILSIYDEFRNDPSFDPVQKENPTAQMGSEADEVIQEIMGIVRGGTDADRRDMLEVLRIYQSKRNRG